MHAALKTRLDEVRGRIAEACRRSSREQSTVRLIGVTKYVTAEVAASLHLSGLADLGESRPQELWQKAPALPDSVRWHLIGQLQRNKVERTLPLVNLIHSIDSLRLLEAIGTAAKAQNRIMPVLLEVNVSREEAKHGFTVEELPPLGQMLSRLPNVEVQGLMTMAALDNPENARSTFAELRKLRDAMTTQWGRPLPELSMGMTNDFEVAIEEGATMVRIGSALFEGIV